MDNRSQSLMTQQLLPLLSDRDAWRYDAEGLWLASLSVQPPRCIDILLRPDGDVDVAFSLTRVTGSPFEQHFAVHDRPLEEAAVSIAHFVNQLAGERLALTYGGGWAGGRRFVEITGGSPTEADGAEWVASWRGTYDRNLDDERPRPPAAARIRAARLRAGLDEGTVAARLDMTFESYRDLEDYDDEVFNCLSLREVQRLGEILDVPAAALVIAEGSAAPGAAMSPDELVGRLVDHIERRQFTPDSFGDHVGWDILPALEHPASLWDDWNIDCLGDVCDELGVDWLAVLV